MITVCEVCGELGYEHLLLSCENCNEAVVHRYCMDTIVYEGPWIDWSCCECHPTHGEVTKERSLEVFQDDKTMVGTQSENGLAVSALGSNHYKPATDGSGNDLMLERNKDKFQLHDGANNDLQQISMAASVPQPSTLHEDSVARNMPSSANADGLIKESNCMPSGNIKIGNSKGSCVGVVFTGENQSERSMLLDEASTSSLSKESSKVKIVQEAKAPQMERSDAVENFCKRKRRKLILPDDYDDDVDVELSNTVQSFVKDSPRKQRKLILPDDDDDDVDVELSNTVQSFVKDSPRKQRKLILPDDYDDDVDVELSNTVQNFVKDSPRKQRKLILPDDYDDDVDVELSNTVQNGQSLKNDSPVNKQKCLEDGEYDPQLDSLVPQPVESTWPIKKRRRYIDSKYDEEGEVIVGSVISECALKDVARIASQPVDAKDPHLQSRTTFDSDSDSVNRQYYINSRPIDMPVWSGIFKAESNVAVMFAAHLSTKACQRVLEIARSLPPVVEILKLPRLEAWPKRWNTSGPTDDNIGLYFFPHSMRSNEESDRLVKEVIESDVVLKVILGAVELLIFPSIFLPEYYHVFQGRHYLWGVFKPRKCNLDTAVLIQEQDGLACASEEGEVRQHQVLDQDQQCEVQCMSCDEPNPAKSQQLIQEMANEGALLFSVSEEAATSRCAGGKSDAVLTTDNGYQHVQERRRHPIQFVPMDHGDSDMDPEACLELFPVRQEQIGLISRADVNKELELDLSLGARRRPSALP
ncbi:hypothetical protein ABZP36_011676 [Zizania latifolia]